MALSAASSSASATAATSSTVAAATAPRAEEIAAGARRLTEELAAFLDKHPSLQTASTAQAKSNVDVPELQLSTCRKLREVRRLCLYFVVVDFCSLCSTRLNFLLWYCCYSSSCP